MANEVVVKYNINQDGQCYYSQMGHPTYLSTTFYNLSTYLSTYLLTYLPTYLLQPITYLPTYLL
jgi:hypothetical protein